MNDVNLIAHRGSGKSMASLLMLQQAREDLARNLEALDVKGSAFTGMLPWHEDKDSWSEFLRGEDPKDYAALSGMPGPRVVDLKRKASDRRRAKLAKASRKRNR